MNVEEEEGSVSLCEAKSAFKCRINTYVLKNNEHFELDGFFRDAFPLFESETQKLLNKFSILKLNTCLEAKFIKPSKDDENEDNWDIIVMYIQTRNRVIDVSKDKFGRLNFNFE